MKALETDVFKPNKTNDLSKQLIGMLDEREEWEHVLLYVICLEICTMAHTHTHTMKNRHNR